MSGNEAPPFTRPCGSFWLNAGRPIAVIASVWRGTFGMADALQPSESWADTRYKLIAFILPVIARWGWFMQP